MKPLVPDVLCSWQVEHKMLFSKANNFLWKGFDSSLHEIENSLGVLRQQGIQASAFLSGFALVVLSVSNLSRRRCQEVVKSEEEHCS